MRFTDVDEIDFLPADVHVRRALVRARKWRWGIAAAFVALTVVGLVGNRLQHARLTAARDALKPRVDAVASIDAQVAAVRSEIELAGLQADLRASLRLRAATTRLIAAATRPLPAHVSVTELRIADQGLAVSPRPALADQQKAGPPERRDLERLASEAQSLRRVVTVRGLAPDDAAVSDYLDGLRTMGPFEEVRLLFTDRHQIGSNELRSFAAELRARNAIRPSAVRVASRRGTP